MATLYELSMAYLELLSMAEEEETDEQAIKDTLESLDGEVEDIIDGCACVMRQLSAEADAIDREIERLTKRKKTVQRNHDRIKDGIENIMRISGRPKIKTTLFSFSIQKRAASVFMETDDIERIPERFWRVKPPEIDKVAIKEALKNGENLDGIAHLEQGEGLVIR